MAAKQPDSLILIDAHRPELTTGTYEVSVDQKLDADGVDERGQVVQLVDDSFAARIRFHVLGPRLGLEPGWIAGRFPGPHSKGDHANVLPHVALSRSTLPWERNAEAGGDPEDPVPWLAVLLLTDDEMAAQGSVPATLLHEVDAGELFASTTSRPPLPAFPGLDVEKGSEATDRVRVVDVPRIRLEPTPGAPILPSGQGLSTLTHVRERFVGTIPTSFVASLDEEQLTPELRAALRQHGCPVGPQANVAATATGEEWTITDRETGRTWYLELDTTSATIDLADEARAIIVSCRATRAGQRYRAFLVSVEGRYTDAGGVLAFDYGSATANDLVRLVVLDTWTFEVDTDAGNLEVLLEGLVADDPTGSAPTPKTLTLTVPTDGRSGPGVDLLAAGYALLPHQLRNGGTTRTWYRGPLRPIPPVEAPDLATHNPVITGDALVLVDHLYQLLDCSYAAAWELGRHLLLSNREIALDLVSWKRSVHHWAHRRDQPLRHLPGPEPGPLPDVPSSVVGFVERLTLLDGLPFNYLVPDPAMLPLESIKTFVLDHRWIYCLIDGMMSLDRLHDGDLSREDALAYQVRLAAYQHLLTGPDRERPEQVSGVLIRSEVIAAWPDLHIELFHPDDTTILLPLRRVGLSDNVLLILVAGRIGRIRLHPNMEALHHGVERAGIGQPDPTPMLSDDVIDTAALANPSAPATTRGAADVAHVLLASGPPRLDIDVAAT